VATSVINASDEYGSSYYMMDHIVIVETGVRIINDSFSELIDHSLSHHNKSEFDVHKRQIAEQKNYVEVQDASILGSIKEEIEFEDELDDVNFINSSLQSVKRSSDLDSQKDYESKIGMSLKLYTIVSQNKEWHDERLGLFDIQADIDNFYEVKREGAGQIKSVYKGAVRPGNEAEGFKDIPHGKGMKVFSDGIVVIGEFKDNKLNGI